MTKKTSYIELHFSDSIIPILDKVAFAHPINAVQNVCTRGTIGTSISTTGTFKWSKAVQAIAELFTKSALANLTKDYENLSISGEGGSLSASLDYAVSKKTSWIMDLFGVTSDGNLIARRLFKFKNSNRKRPGPVSIELNQSFLGLESIFIYRGSVRINSITELELLLRDLSVSNESIGKKGLFKVRGFSHVKFNPAPLLMIGEEDLSLTSKSLSDLIITILDTAGELKESEIDRIIRSETGLRVPASRLQTVLSQLHRKEVIVLNRMGYSISPSHLALRSNLKTQIEELSVQIKGRSEVQCFGKDSFEVEFSSLSEMDRYLASLHASCLKMSSSNQANWWHLSHALWPVMRPTEEHKKSSNFPNFSNTFYICSGSTDVDKWVANFYKTMGVFGFTNRQLLYSSDFWVIGDIIVCQDIPERMQSALSNFVSEHNDISEFDNVGLRKTIYDTAERSSLRVMLAPGLAMNLRNNLNKASHPNFN